MYGAYDIDGDDKGCGRGEKIKDYLSGFYNDHKEIIDAGLTIGAGVGGYLLAAMGLNAIDAPIYLSAVIDGWSSLSPYADATAKGITAFTAAISGKIPTKYYVKKYLAREEDHKKGAAYETGDEFVKSTAEGGVHAWEHALHAAEEAFETTLLASALGTPLSFTDLKEAYHGLKSEMKNIYTKIKNRYNQFRGKGSDLCKDSQPEEDIEIDKIIQEIENYTAGDYVDKLRDRIEDRAYPI